MIPAAPPLQDRAMQPLFELLRGRRAVVLAGAGCSTESGIPDYRGPESRRRPRRPIRYQEFVGDGHARVRYWARSTVGWPRMSRSRPNNAHRALARLEEAGTVPGVITQNVDGLHYQAGSRRVIELHGSLGRVECLGCGESVSREAFQQRLLSVNAEWVRRLGGLAPGAAETAPDGDVELPPWAERSFRVPGCQSCDGILKPDVVFFGENVPKPRVERAWRLFEEGDVLLVVGSSLTVYSGRRFVYRAQKEGMPIAVVNIGPTRADDVAAVKVEGRLGQVLDRLAGALVV